MDKVIVPQRLGVGSMTQVAAKGPQDTVMYRNVDEEKDSMFQFKHKPYVFFASNTTELEFKEDIYDFGSTISLDIKYGDKFMADTISDLYLSIDLPALDQVPRKIDTVANTFTMNKKNFDLKEAYNSEMITKRPSKKVVSKPITYYKIQKIQNESKMIEVKNTPTPTPIQTLTPTPTPIRKISKPTLKYVPIIEETTKLPLSSNILTPTPVPQQEFITMKYKNVTFKNTPLPVTLNTPTPTPDKYPSFTPLYDPDVFYDPPLTLKYSIPKQTPCSTPVSIITNTPLPTTPVPTTPVPVILNTPIQALYVPVIHSTPVPMVISTPVPKVISTPAPIVHTPMPYVQTPVPNVVHTPAPTHMVTPMQSESTVISSTPTPVILQTPAPTIITTPIPSDIKPVNVRETPIPNIIHTPVPEPKTTPSGFVELHTPTPIPMIFVTPEPNEPNVYTLKYNLMQVLVTPEPTPSPVPEQMITPEPIILTTPTPTPLSINTPTPTPMSPIIIGTPTPLPLTIGQLITMKYNVPVYTSTPLSPDIETPTPSPVILNTPTPVPVITPTPIPFITPEPIIELTPVPPENRAPITLKYKTMTLKYKTNTKNSFIVSKNIKNTFSKISGYSQNTPTPIPMRKINGFVPTPSPKIKHSKNMMKNVNPTYLYNDTFYTNKIGYALIDRVVFSVDNEVITEYSGEELELHNRLFTSKAHEAGIKEMIGIYDTENEIRNNGLANKKLHVPLPLFWSKTYKQHFPLVAMSESVIDVKVSFKKLKDIAYVFGTTETVYMRVGANGSINLTVGASDTITACEPLRAKLMVEHHILSPIEKTFFQRNVNEFLFKSPSKNTLPIKDKLNKLQLTFLQPTEWLAFCYRERGNGRYQYSKIESLRLYFNGVERVREPPNTEYYRLLQKHLFFDNNPNDNVYIYSFALRAGHGQPSGSMNMSKVIKKELEIIVPDKASYDDELIVFSSSYNVLKTDGTKGTLMFY